jgi:hypothetical protein
MQALQTQREFELALAEGDGRQQYEIKKKYAAKELEIRRQSAKLDKAQALFNIALQTAQNVVKYTGGLPFTAPLLALAVATGVAQTALVLAQKLPAFAKGTESAPGGAAVVGERGRELIVHGDKATVVDKPSIVNLPRGAQVIPNPKTEEILGTMRDIRNVQATGTVTAQLAQQLGTAQDHHVVRAVARAFEKTGSGIQRAIQRKKDVTLLVHRDGYSVTESRAGYIRRHITKTFYS